jgi:hypothetical protein
MQKRQIKDRVYWMGAVDWDSRLFDSLIPLPDGTSYNAYLIEGSEKTALLDTVDPPKAEELLGQLEGVSKLDFIVAHHAEQDQCAGRGIDGCDFRHHAARALGQYLARAALAPVPAVGRDRERFGPHNLAPDATGQAEAVAADALQAGLVVVRGAEPGPGDGDHHSGIVGRHSTAPSCPPSLVA